MRLTTSRARDGLCRGDPKHWTSPTAETGRAGSEPVPFLDGPASSSRGSQASSIGPGWCCSTSGDMSTLLVGLSSERGRFMLEGQSHEGLGLGRYNTTTHPPSHQLDLRCVCMQHAVRPLYPPPPPSVRYSFLEQTWHYDNCTWYSEVWYEGAVTVAWGSHNNVYEIGNSRSHGLTVLCSVLRKLGSGTS